MQNKSYTKAELADLYGFSAKKFRSELHTMDYYKTFPKSKRSQILTPIQLDYIFENIGTPNGFNTEK